MLAGDECREDYEDKGDGIVAGLEHGDLGKDTKGSKVGECSRPGWSSSAWHGLWYYLIVYNYRL